ncbi:IclR family transcriptional regulator [Synergistales bacterium]|nr:IclR family transcriptional regulator [Synergistales bacterium]
MAKDDHNAVDRIADILEYVATHKEGATFSEVMRSISIPRSSLHPLIHTLCKRQFLYYKENERRYFLGDKIFSLSIEYRNNIDVLNMIDVMLAELAKNVDATCYFGVLAGNEVLYLLRQIVMSPIQIIVRPGYRLKAYAASIGKALLSQFNKDELTLLYPDGLEPITKNTVADIDKLYLQLSRGKEEGVFYEKEESAIHVQCVAAPVCYQQKVIAALSIAFPVFDDTQNHEKIQFNKENLLLTKQKVEDIIAKNGMSWIYGG